MVFTILAMVAFYCAMLPLSRFNVSHAGSGGIDEEIDWEINFIRKQIPVRLIPPDSLNRSPGFLLKWMLAETEARFGVAIILWVGGVILIVLLHKNNSPESLAGKHAG